MRGEDLAAWTADQYGPGPYPAAFIGAGSGAAVHLAAALRAPVLPQTYLVSVRARLDPDQPRAALDAGQEFGRQLVKANPDLALCHMHDLSQDRAYLVLGHPAHCSAEVRVLGAKPPPASTSTAVRSSTVRGCRRGCTVAARSSET